MPTRHRLFQKAAVATFVIFSSVMFFVTIASYWRASGNTGLDPAKIQQMRFSKDKL